MPAVARWIRAIIGAIGYLFRRSLRLLDSKSHEADLTEKKEDDYGTLPETPSAQVSGYHGAVASGSVQRRHPSKALRAEDIWTAAAQGAIEVVLEFRYKDEGLNVNEVHPKLGLCCRPQLGLGTFAW